MCVAAIVIAASCFVTGCQEDYDIIGNDNFIENIDNSSLEIGDFKNWFESQKVVKGLIGEQEPDWDNAEIKLMPDGNSSLVAIEIYKGKNSLGNDSIIELQIAYVKNSFIGGVKVFSFYNQEYAHANYYNLSGKILEEGKYYAPKQLYSLFKRYTVKGTQVRLKSGSTETNDPCAGTGLVPNSATPQYNEDGSINSGAYNCHYYVWGSLSSSSPYYDPSTPKWNNFPDIAGSGYSQVSTPQVGDRWVSYFHVSNFGDVALHSAIVVEVTNGQVTKVRAKCGHQGIYTYDPACNEPLFAAYLTNDIRYYRLY
jgi:hypothetical protein